MTAAHTIAQPFTGWITLNEAAEIARVSAATLRREIRHGRLRHARVGGRKAIRIRPEWIDAWLEQSTPTENLR
jgi:excisionase family DNA binding protein